ncbi:hypothetical protein B0H11DRAFT_1911705 [Mycena galericulata]|nr:hypothetical protein B0H11DRAFT_1911705 [Mycena galericulata]
MYWDESDKCASTTKVLERDLKGVTRRTSPTKLGGVLAGSYEERAAAATTSSRKVFERDLKDVTRRTSPATLGGVLAGSYEERAAAATTSSRKVFERDLKDVTRRTSPATLGGVLAGSYEERAAAATTSSRKVFERDLKDVTRRTSPAKLGGVLAGSYEERAAAATTSSRKVFDRDLKGVTRRTSPAKLGGVLAGTHEERAETTEIVRTMESTSYDPCDFWKPEIWAYFECECETCTWMIPCLNWRGSLQTWYSAANKSRGTTGCLVGIYEERAAAPTTSFSKVVWLSGWPLSDLKDLTPRMNPTELGGLLAGMYEERAAAPTTSSSKVGWLSGWILQRDLKGIPPRSSPAELEVYFGIGNRLRASPLIRSYQLPSSRKIWGLQNEGGEAEASKPGTEGQNSAPLAETAPDKKARARASTAAYYQKKYRTHTLGSKLITPSSASQIRKKKKEEMREKRKGLPLLVSGVWMLKKAAQDRERRQKYAKPKDTMVAAPQAQLEGLNSSELEVSQTLAAMQEQRRLHLEHSPQARSDCMPCGDANYPADEQLDEEHTSETEMLPPSDEEDSDEEPGARSISEVAQDNEGQGNGSDEDREPDPSWSSDEEKEEEHTPISDEPHLRSDRRYRPRLRLATPSYDSPSPELQARLPSFYDALDKRDLRSFCDVPH